MDGQMDIEMLLLTNVISNYHQTDVKTVEYIRQDADKFLKLIDQTISIGLTTSASVAGWTATVATTITTAVTIINNSTATPTKLNTIEANVH